MKIVLVHVSDVHISTVRYPDNPILSRVPSMIAALRSLFLCADDVSACLLLATGDIAYAGLKEEYDLALPFFRELQDSLRTLYGSAQQHTVLIPGNHDCNFEKDKEARRKLIDEPDPDSLADGSIVAVATVVQEDFFEFCREYNGSTAVVSGLDRLQCTHIFAIADKRIEVRALNSAWGSQIPESRNLMLPMNYLSNCINGEGTSALAITMLHHPYNWFEPNNARALRKLLEESSDIILTGHEHSASTYTKTGLTGEKNEYIEGGVLQENTDPSSSGFNAIVIDIDAESQEIHTFVWDGDLYECVNEVVPQPFVRNKYRLRSEFELNSDFEDVLNDPEAAYTHPHKDRILLDDVFMYPDLTELDTNHSRTTKRVVHGRDLITHIQKRERVIITASERAGKTAIARSLFKDLRLNGTIPLLLNGRDIKPALVKKSGRHFDQVFSSQYSSLLKSRYWQLDKSARSVIVDDYHRLPITKDVRDALVQEMVQRFGVVILIGGNELRVQELMGHDRESRLLWTFNHCEVMGFGLRLRAEFIRKWYRIGRAGHVDDDLLVKRAIELAGQSHLAFIGTIFAGVVLESSEHMESGAQS